jgi:2-oxoglutarate ferredoxin oxidoreductase subunit delta
MAAANKKRGWQKLRSIPGEKESDKVIFYHDWCKQCNICVAFCPKQALAMDDNNYPQLVAPEQCSSCGLC